MEELGVLLRREEHYRCEDYFSVVPPQNEELVASLSGGRGVDKMKTGLEGLPAPVLLNMLQECASLVTDTSTRTTTKPCTSVGSPDVSRRRRSRLSSNSLSEWAPPRSPSSVSAMHGQNEPVGSTDTDDKGETSAQSTLHRKPAQDFVYWRKQMCNWAFVVVNNFDIDKETVAVAFNLLDRYVARERNVPGAPTITREDYQLFAMTSLYIAVKVFQPYPKKIAVDALVVMSREFYSQEDILHTEREMLMALEWKISTPTVMVFCRNLMEDMDDDNDCDKQEMERICALLADHIVADAFFVPLHDSLIGLACVMHAAHLMGVANDATLQQFAPAMKLIGGQTDCLLLESILEKLEHILC